MKAARTTRLAGRATAVLALVAVVAGCAGPEVVDGIRLGSTSSCGGQGSCADYETAGRAWLDSAVPGHAAVVGVEVREIVVLDAFGNQVLSTNGGRATLGVELRLADGTVRATTVVCGIVQAPCSAVPLPSAPPAP